jgi:hypothetical protein
MAPVRGPPDPARSAASERPTAADAAVADAAVADAAVADAAVADAAVGPDMRPAGMATTRRSAL